MKSFLDQYTRDMTSVDVQRLFTRDTPEAYHYFVRGVDFDKLAAQPWYRRWVTHVRLVFVGFSMRLSPARRALYGVGVLALVIGLLASFRDVGTVRAFSTPFHIVLPWAPGTVWLVIAFMAVNLLVLMEVADRLSLKSDLEIARDIQLAMLPSGQHEAGTSSVCGVTRPANTVGGDFYDVLTLADGRIVIALGDVAGKGSPAALLMALLLAMLRTLVDEGLETSRLVSRLNAQVARHSPASRFITLFFSVYDPRDGRLEYVNAGHLPPILRREDGTFERPDPGGNGLALGMFAEASYDTRSLVLNPGDLMVLFSDGITEAENGRGVPFDEAGAQAVIAAYADRPPDAIGRAMLAAVETHAGDTRLADDLTALVLKRGI